MYRKSASGWIKHIDFIILDVVCMHISFVLAYVIRHGGFGIYQSPQYNGLMVVMAVLDILTAVLFFSFKNVLRRGLFLEFIAALRHVALVEAMTIFFVFSIQKAEEYSRAVFYVFPFIYVALTTLARIGWKVFLHRTKNIQKIHNILLVTTKERMNQVAEDLYGNKYEQFRIKGIALLGVSADFDKSSGLSDIPVMAAEQAVSFVCDEWVDAVMIDVPAQEEYPSRLEENFRKMGIVVHRVIAKRSETSTGQYVERIGNYTVLTSSINYATTGQLFVKRMIDIAGGLVGCILTGMICLVFGPLIYIQSPGPIFFTQTRVGKNGKPFKIYKLRTMYLDAEERKAELLASNRVKGGYMFKLEYDPRIIGNKKLDDGTIKKGIGSFLRESSLDEFPQFINVLKGDMSLIGTRPPTMDEWEKYELHHRARLAIKPGLTGMWQVSGRSEITDFEEVVKLDTQYISEWNLGLDIKILVKTVLIVFGKKGAM